MPEPTETDEELRFQAWAKKLKDVLGEGFAPSVNNPGCLELDEEHLLGALTVVAEVALLVGRTPDQVLVDFRRALDQADKTIRAVREKYVSIN
jgi:hypothetical protein